MTKQTPTRPRFYQRQAIDSAIWAWEDFRTILIHIGTGGGKTFISSQIIKEFAPYEKCLFVADQDELIVQSAKSIHRFAGIIPAIEKAKHRASLNAAVVVASSQTLSRKDRLERFPRNHFGKIIIDEAHKSVSRNEKIMDYFETAKVCGMTATPFRSDLADLSKWYASVVFRKPMMDLTAEGFAPPWETVRFPIEIDLASARESRTPDGKEYNAEDADCTITPHMQAICAAMSEHAKTRHGIAYLPLIKTSQAFTRFMRESGITANHVDGDSHDRDQLLEGFSRGYFSWLSNASLLSTGVDLPIADAFLNLQPMHSRGMYQQRFGRVMRVLPGVIDDLTEESQSAERRARIAASAKPMAYCYDLLWQHEKLSVMRPEHLIANSQEEADAMTRAIKCDGTPQDLLAIQKAVQKEREQQLIDALMKAASQARLTEPMTLEQAAAFMGDKTLVDYVPIQRWEIEPPIEAQLKQLANLKIDPASVKSKGHANLLLCALSDRREKGFASVQQQRFLYQLNGEVAELDRAQGIEQITYHNAQREINRLLAVRKNSRLIAHAR